MKTCAKCGIQKDESNFYYKKNNKLLAICKKCENERTKINYYSDLEKSKNIRKKYRDNHKLQSRIYHKEYNKKYSKILKDKRKKYYQENQEKLKNQTKKYYEENKEKLKLRDILRYKRNRLKRSKQICEYYKKRFKHNLFFRFKVLTTNCIRSTLQAKGYKKNSKTSILLGCSIKEFQEYLGAKPEGNYELDHICPCAQAKTKEELIKLQHYSNFRWLSTEDNNTKKDKWTLEGEKLCIKLLEREWINKGEKYGN